MPWSKHPPSDILQPFLSRLLCLLCLLLLLSKGLLVHLARRLLSRLSLLLLRLDAHHGVRLALLRRVEGLLLCFLPRWRVSFDFVPSWEDRLVLYRGGKC